MMNSINKSSEKTHMLAESAILIAMATALSLIPIYPMPLGGTVTPCSMFPLFIVSYKYGVKKGMLAGFIYSVIQLLLGISTVAYVPTVGGIILCCLFDYILPYTALGLAGIFTSKGKITIMRVIGGMLIAIFVRYSLHVLSGVVVWYEITKAGGWNDYVNKVGMWTYSMVYNITFLGPDAALDLVIAPLLIRIIRKRK